MYYVTTFNYLLPIQFKRLFLPLPYVNFDEKCYSLYTDEVAGKGYCINIKDG